jgi:hypothetical protein
MRQSLRNARKIIRTLTNSAHGRSPFPLLRKALPHKEKTARDGVSRAVSASIGGCP